MGEIKLDKKVEQWKARLLDFTKRNRLLNFKTNKSTLQIDHEIEEVFSLLLNDKAIRVNTIVNIAKDAEKLTIEATSKGEFSEKEVKDIYNRSLIKISQKLEKQLNDIRLKGKSSLDEKGINTLYLACGFLNWTEVDYSKDVLRSPILLIPITLSRVSAREPYYLGKLDDDIILNPVLEQKLKLDFGINLSPLDNLEFESFEEIINYYEAELKVENTWKVTKESYIGLFSFSKLVMYKDFELYLEKVKDNRFVKEYAGIKQEKDICNRDEAINIYDYDQTASSEESFQILDADSSQQEAIIAAKRGVSFVMQGPPGTGKSQTITNIIAESLSQGKNVLFVSEKKAALDVVKKRLADKGLSDYILDLHSHNSNKKTVLADLKNSLDQKTSPYYLYQSYSEFDEIKRSLNEYVKVLHKKIAPLNETPQKIHGKLANLDTVEELLFDLNDVEHYTTNKINDIKKKLKRLEEVKSLLGNEDSHFWKAVRVQETSFELEANISSNFKMFAKRLAELYTDLKQATEMVEFKWELTLGDLDHLTDLAESIRNKPIASDTWFGTNGKEILRNANENVEKHSIYFSTYQNVKKEILSKFNDEVLETDIDCILKVITSDYQNEISPYVDNYSDFINKLFSDESIKTNIEKANILYKEYDSFVDEFFSLMAFKINTLSSEENIRLEKVLNYIKNDPKPTENWFRLDQKETVKKVLMDTKDHFGLLINERNKVCQIFDIGIIEEDIDSLIERYVKKYSTFFRFMNKDYRADKSLVNSYLHQKTKLPYAQTIRELRNVKKYKEFKKQIEEKEEFITSFLGKGYAGENTDWDQIQANFESMCALDIYLDSSNMKEELLPFILDLNTHTIEAFRNLVEKYKVLYDQISGILYYLKYNAFSKLNDINQLTDLVGQKERIRYIGNITSSLLKAKYEFSKLQKNKSDLLSVEVLENLQLNLEKIKSVSKEIENSTKDFTLYYGDLYKEHNTDWTGIKEAIDWTIKAEANFEGWFPKSFVEVINNDDKLARFLSICTDVQYKRNKLEDLLEYYLTIFNANEGKFNGKSIFHENIKVVASSLDVLSNQTSSLQEWLTFQESLMDVNNLGLQDFVKKISSNRDSIDNSFVDIFMKRYYKLWLDDVYRQHPPLRKFRIDQHKKLVEEFKELDETHIDNNSARLHEILTKVKEEYIERNTFRSSEIALLKREIQKQKRHKPIRKLFGTIPELLLSLKPCMMMSPLSVSQFIDPSILSFDVIIFDEASQIRPEDAIGSIIRGKQLIIAGDDKQLPPTSFFNQQIEVDEEFMDEEDEDIYEDFESILDESLQFMPEISLKWHYRSKQESLIAFSNKEIYNNELYTFPNSIHGEHDGISHVFVEDGVYDRGGSKRNLKEAERVAKLVFEHIERSPERSLGVIAFSEAQQEAIREQVDYLRRENPEYEHFFSESHFESFFVKNLENVQGDERDTIIISVGYGKDATGKIYYNFGPLNKEGGERRLNVVVSRAKKEIKVVSSIKDVDLDDVKLNKRGPKLLKAYLAFAQKNGEFAIATDVDIEADFDSPFEQDVYDSLEKKGLTLRKQVGCSGYRIDLAVIDPDKPGKYLLGIECDGATYHSSKTARDRDRLRQGILESLGWRIYRIWSQDWVKRKKEIVNEIVNTIKEDNFIRS
ncbi:DUF4011 domain-containing protein [Litchfieldia alkalitelluris]|uniref:DUF4011 domain-containing protein n=1 Tax=Litchfieldia alkalitelluris TaxID=304268 RepID=UPI0009975A76|nr:DUF4011 domain-containing protein [Litchfieldia alkalitelluris]